jgi:hypothetical protein
MKPDTDHSGAPFDFNALPTWLYPDVWNENKSVKLRGLWFILLYTISTLLFTALVFVPIALYLEAWFTPFVIWLILGFGWGPLIGLGVWWDFTKRARKLKALDK